VQILASVRCERFTFQSGQDSCWSPGWHSFALRGDFLRGGIRDRGAPCRGGCLHALSFVAYLPDLVEYGAVDSARINGIADGVLLSGDGLTNFTVTLQSSQTANSNMIGAYRIAADGAIADVALLFGNTLDPSAAGSSFDLGLPGAGESIGFFLVVDGFTAYGDLADDLSFVGSAETGWTLHSASRGALEEAAVFHTVADYNPGGAVQVLSACSRATTVCDRLRGRPPGRSATGTTGRV